MTVVGRRLGYHRVATLGPAVPNGFGHYGFGGSGAFADPDRELAVALTLNSGVGTPFGDIRIVRIGTIAQYNSTGTPYALRNLPDIVEKSLRMEGFLVRDYRRVQEELYEFAVPHLQSGRVALDETVVDGFGGIVDAFLGMLRGENQGKIIVRAAGADV